MQTRHQIKDFLEKKAYNLRVASLKMTTQAGSGHPTSCFSAADIVAALFFYAMQYDPRNFHNPYNDRFILSKGHASPLLYAAWQQVGVISEQELMTYRHIDSVLEGHPTLRFEYTEAATGSLGMGLSIGAGMAKYSKMFQKPFKTFVVIGDSEASEGQIWEAVQLAAYYKLNNLIGIIDCNNLGQSTHPIFDHHVERYVHLFESFGWKSVAINGHDMQEIMGALDKARQSEDRPVMIVAKTVKGYGIEEVENKMGAHGKPFTKEELQKKLDELEKRFAKAASFDEATFDWHPTIPDKNEKEVIGCVGVEIKDPTYKKTEKIATRKAYGKALASLGGSCKNIVSLDAEVKNSTFAEYFEEKFPERFVQCFIAEQNMVSMAVGMQRRGAVPFVSTFGAFFSRATDQIRMAAIGNAALRLVGSHAGVSIGEDGPSQMALEDIAYMRTLPGSVVLYPCDAVSTHKLVGQLLEYNQGISYLRTTRMDTDVIYDFSEVFSIGGCKVLRSSAQDHVCIIAAGVTVFEALKAYDVLRAKGISAAIIDLYSVKPLDSGTITRMAKNCKRVITVEDHYLEGGLGQAVAYELRNENIAIECLAVKQLPRSGKPQELIKMVGIDSGAIVAAVERLVGNR